MRSPRVSIFESKNLLAVYLLAIGLDSWVFYLIPSGYYDRNVNLLATLPPQQRTQTETNPAAASLTPKFAEWLQRALAARKER